MNREVTQRSVCCCSLLAITVVIGSQGVAKEDQDSYKYYQVDTALISFDASQSLASYRSSGKASGTPGAKLECSTSEIEISIALSLESNHLYADVTTHRRGMTGDDGAKKQRLDLTNLRPTSVDVGADKDGRAYQLNLVPSIQSVQVKARSFQEASDDLYRLKFHSSSVMLNNDKYIGRMLASDAEVFTIEVCGVASLEFSLHHLKGAEPWGQLQDGQIKISNPDGTSIEIGNVTNGTDSHFVSGGPYLVWVRWGEPHQTVEEYRAKLTDFRDQLKSGTATVAGASSTADALAVVDQQLARGPGPWVTGCSARDLPKKEYTGDE